MTDWTEEPAIKDWIFFEETAYGLISRTGIDLSEEETEKAIHLLGEMGEKYLEGSYGIHYRIGDQMYYKKNKYAEEMPPVGDVLDMKLVESTIREAKE